MPACKVVYFWCTGCPSWYHQWLIGNSRTQIQVCWVKVRCLNHWASNTILNRTLVKDVRYAGPAAWNSLPHNIKLTTDNNRFKWLLKSHLLFWHFVSARGQFVSHALQVQIFILYLLVRLMQFFFEARCTFMSLNRIMPLKALINI